MTRSRPVTTPTVRRSVRDRLIDAAEECLRAKGIRATTVSEVAEVAGVSRGWLYRHFPDKVTLLGAAIVRLNNAYWSDAHALLERVDGLDRQLAAGIRHGRTAYDDPGALLMKLRLEEPEEFAACAGAGVQGLVPDLADFWTRYLIAARDAGDVHVDTNIAEASEWVARVIISLATVPGDTLDAADSDAVLTHVRRYVMPGLRADPSV
ncbi:TetR/AcrR family transcriptional regulator [Mycolicibacterium arenosum]|uniref:TetR/AcrR family transcriptional regulator n=1 Tax=Mycolicibacterium arenosum TaxID=2952157 RepID=UPI0038CD1AD5